jgi:hypothetical protein
MQIQRNISHTVLPKKTAYQWFVEALANHNNDECLLWPFGKTGNGYGAFRLHKQNISVHIAAFEETFGAVPEGLWVLHKCDTPPCFNPRHLFAGTCSDNEIDKHSKMRGHYGIDHHNNVLTEDQVREIRALSKAGSSSYAISRLGKFGVSKQTVLSIVRRDTWRHI